MGTNDTPAIRVDHLAKRDPPGMCLLRLLAMLAPAPLDRVCLHSAAVEEIVRPLCERIGGNEGSQWGLDRAIDRLVTESLLVTHAHDDGTTMLHGDTAVLDVVRKAIPIAEIKDWVHAALRLVDAHAPEDSDDPRRWPLYRRLQPHIERIIELAEQHAIPEPTGRLMGEKLGVFVYLNGDRQRGEQLFRRALSIDEAHFGPRHAQVAVDCNNLSIAIDRPASRAESEVLIARAVDILLDQEQQQGGRLATSLGVLAGVLRRRGLSAQVEPIYRLALELDEQHCGKEHIAVARDLRLLAIVLLSQGHASAAEPLIERALAIDEKEGPCSPNVPADLRLLATVSRATDPTADVLALLERAASIDAQWFGANSEQVLDALFGLADACATRKEPKRGARHLQDALTRACSAATPDLAFVSRVLDKVAAVGGAGLDFDPEVLLGTLSRLEHLRAPLYVVQRARLAASVALRHRQRWREARALMLDVEEAKLREATERSPNNPQAWNALAMFAKNQRGDFDAAESCYRRAVELAPDDPTILGNLGMFLTRCRGMNDEAELLLRRAVELAPKDANLLSALGFFLQHERGLPEQAEPFFQRALEASPNEAAVAANVACLRLQQGNTPEAMAQIGRSLRAEAESEITLRALFLGAVAARFDHGGAASWLARLRRLLARGIVGTTWHPRGLLAELPKRVGAEDARFFAALQAFLFPGSGRTVDAGELDEFEAWRSAVGAEIDEV